MCNGLPSWNILTGIMSWGKDSWGKMQRVLGEGRGNPPPLHRVSNLGRNQHVDLPAQDNVCSPEKVLRVGHRQRRSGTSASQLKIALLLGSSVRCLGLRSGMWPQTYVFISPVVCGV